jgi:hypothetical protein
MASNGQDPAVAGRSVPKSLTPRSRFSIDSQRSPSGAAIATTMPKQGVR